MIGLLLAAALAPQMPDRALTPGAVNPAATLSVICVRGYTSQSGVRHVTAATKRKVFAEYGVDRTQGGPYEVDHLISLELGGSNDIKNLWPQSYTSAPYNAHLKDALENRLHAMVCAGKLDLATAQREIAGNWIAAYQAYVKGLGQ
jgi:hypothetical protein